MKINKATVAAVISALFISASVHAEPMTKTDSPESAAMLMKLKEKYPSTTISSVKKTQFQGIYEVQMGKNIAYAEQEGRYFIFGHLFDMVQQRDITEERLAEMKPKLDIKALPTEDAIKEVRGTGKGVLYVFSDPDCPYCKQLENNLAGVTDVTIYTFLFPIAQLHPDAKRKAEGVWCAKDRAKAWSDLMKKGTVNPAGCDTPIERNIALAEQMGISGTPTLIFADGEVAPGAMPTQRISQILAQQGKKQ